LVLFSKLVHFSLKAMDIVLKLFVFLTETSNFSFKLFNPFGPIPCKGIKAKTNPDGSCAGVGWVDFIDISSAHAAKEMLNGLILPDGQVLKVMSKRQKDGKGKGGYEKGYEKGGYEKGSKGGGGKGGKGYNRKGDTGKDGAPVGELAPEANEATKRQCAAEFDLKEANARFEKLDREEPADEPLKPLDGYDKKKSFFDSISCEATERAGTSERPKIDREKAREFDRETFGDTRRQPRFQGGKGRRKGGY